MDEHQIVMGDETEEKVEDEEELFFNLLNELFRRPEDYDRLMKGGEMGKFDERLARYGRRRGINLDPVAVERFLEAGARDMAAYAEARKTK